MFSSMVWPYLVNSTAVLVNGRYGCFVLFSKTGRRFVYKRYYHSKSKSKAVVLRVNYSDSGTVEYCCSKV